MKRSINQQCQKKNKKFTDTVVVVLKQIKNQKKLIANLNSIFPSELFILPPIEYQEIVNQISKFLMNYRDAQQLLELREIDLFRINIDQLIVEQQCIEDISNLISQDNLNLVFVCENQEIVNSVQKILKTYKNTLYKLQLKTCQKIDIYIMELKNLYAQTISNQTEIQKLQAQKRALNYTQRQEELDTLQENGYNFEDDFQEKLNQQPFEANYNLLIFQKDGQFLSYKKQFQLPNERSNHSDSDQYGNQYFEIYDYLKQNKMNYTKFQEIFSQILRQLQILDYEEQQYDQICNILHQLLQEFSICLI